MAKKEKHFDEDSKLRFMRFIQVYNIVSIFLMAMLLIFVRGSELALDWTVLTNTALVLSQAAVVWLIAKRKIYTREIIIGIEIFEMVIYLISSIRMGDFSIPGYLVGIAPMIIVAVYFATSKRAKAVLVQPWVDDTLNKIQEENERKLWDLKSKEFWMRLALYFFAFSIMGHWMEMGVQLLVRAGIMPGTLAAPDSLTWRDSLNPFPIYGIAVVVCGLVLYPFYLWLRRQLPRTWQAMALSFLVNMAFCVVAELILGFFFNADYHAWDYRNQFMNFQGQICLLYSVAFGIVSSAITWFVYPLMERAFGVMRRDVFVLVFVICCVLYLLIMTAYNIDLKDLGVYKDEGPSSVVSSFFETSSQPAASSDPSSSLQQAA